MDDMSTSAKKIRNKKGKLQDAKLLGSRMIGIYIDAKSNEPPTDLIRDIIKRFPECDIYKKGTRRIPGQIILDPPLVYIVGQVIPRIDSYESPEQRLSTFRESLQHLLNLLGGDVIEIAIDRGVSPELHGEEDWAGYKEALIDIQLTSSIQFLIYRGEEKDDQ